MKMGGNAKLVVQIWQVAPTIRSTRNHFPMGMELFEKAPLKSPLSQVVVFASRITSFVSHRIRRRLFL